MMVAFRYDNGAVGALYYSREIPSLLQGPARCRSSSAAPGVITFESNGAFVLVRGARPAADHPARACATSAATRRCTAISAGAIRDRPRARDEPRARDGRSAADGSDLREPSRRRRAVTDPLRHHHHRQRRRRRHDGARAGGATPAHPRARARRLRPAGGRELEPGGRLEASPLPDRPSAGSTSAAREFRPYTHYCVGGNTKFWGSVLYRLRREDFGELAARRRRVAGLADRLRHAGAVLRPRRAALPRPRRPRRRSDRTAARPVSRTAPVPHAPGMARDRRRAAGQGLHPSPLPLGLHAARASRAAASCAIPATRSPAGCTRRATRTSAPSRRRSRAPNVTLWTRRVRAAPDHRSPRGTRVEAVEVERDGDDRRASSAPLVDRLVRRGQLGRAAAALGHRPASARAGQLVGPGRPPLHGAPRDDDAGVPSVAAERDRVPEDRRHQRLLPRGPRHAYPLGQIQSQGRTHGVMAQTVVPVDPALGLRRLGVARRRLAGDVRGPARRTTTA